jgi:hypothetical protein
MKITQKSSNKKLLIIIGAIVLLAGASVGAAAALKWGPFAEQSKSEGSTNLDKPTKEQKETGQSAKDQTVNSNGSTTTPGSDPSTIPAPGNGSNKASVSAEITAANQNGETLQVRTLIQLVTNEGTCTVSLKRSDGKTYSEQASVQALSSATTCSGFNIPVSELGSGTWDLTVSFENSGYTASASKQVAIQ